MRINGTNRLNLFRDEMDQLVDSFFNQPIHQVAPAYPALNVWEDDDNLYAEAELPGLRMENLELQVQGNELVIKGERKNQNDEGTTYHRRERGVGTFSRLVRLPVDVDAENVEATLRHGVLTVTLPKAAAAKPRKIEVKALSS
jgi:HSP20 family protein